MCTKKPISKKKIRKENLMAQCKNIKHTPDTYEGLMQGFVMVTSDCPKNTSREYSKYLFIKKDVCDKCYEETLKARERKENPNVV
jgi:hypothetical protein